jgi:hypothetical protein
MQTVLTHSRSANAARMVLLVIASHTDEQGLVVNLSVPDICREANAKRRTVLYAIEELRDELKEMTTEREGNGRGSTFDFDISPLLKRVQISASDKGAESAPIISPQIESKGAENDTEKGANKDGMSADIAPLSDVRVQYPHGTKLAPLLPKTLSTEKNINSNHNRARGGSAFTHEVHAAVQVYRDVFGNDPPVYGQDQIERDVSDLAIWREVCEQWRGNNNARDKVWNMVDAYKKKVNGNGNDGRQSQPGRGVRGVRGVRGRGVAPPTHSEPARQWTAKTRI